MQPRAIRAAALKALLLPFAISVAVPAQAVTITYTASLSGLNESPVNNSPGVGFANVTYNDVAHTLAVSLAFSGLLGTTTASHIHAPTPTPLNGVAGVATTTPTFPGFPLGVTSGTYSTTFDLTNPSFYNAPYLAANGGTPAGAEAALAAALNSDRSYLNIHTTAFPGGEIRGFLVAAVPEPATWSLMILGFGGAGMAIRRRRATVAALA